MSNQTTLISQSEARRLAIAHQGLQSTAPFGKGKKAVYETIAHLGYVQIDTISVTERAHNHVLWSRVPNFSQDHLHDLQKKDRLIIEFWSHAAAFLPMKDYRYLIPTMDYFRNHHDPWPKADKKTLQWVHDRIKSEGALKSRDFDAPADQTKTGWWDWKPAKVALQRLFFSGEVIVSHREGFQRVYDLTERVIPTGIDTSPPTTEEYARYLILNTLHAHGIARAAEMSYLRKSMGAPVKKVLDTLLNDGDIIRIGVKGIDGQFFSLPEYIERPIRISNKIKLLSPFDNAVIQRNRLSDIFGFDYQIECYVPKPKRKYGYYCLPILRGDRFVGRVDVKADRKENTLYLIHLHMEDQRHPETLAVELAQAFWAFAEFNRCDNVILERATPLSWRDAVRQALKNASGF